MGCRRRVPRTSSREDGAEAAQDGARPRRSRPPVRGGSEAAEDRCDDDDDEADVVGRRRGRAGRYRRNRALPAGVEKARSERRSLGGDRSQEIHRLFGGEYSGSGCYIVVTAGREDSRGLGNPMTEPFPRRPRVLGSPRSVALAKEGVPPEWEPGCGAPRRRRPVGRERQPGATGHVTSRACCVTSRSRQRRHPARCGVRPRRLRSALRSGATPTPGRGRRRPLRICARRLPPPSLKPIGPLVSTEQGRNRVGTPRSTPDSGLDHRGDCRFAEVSQVVRG